MNHISIVWFRHICQVFKAYLWKIYSKLKENESCNVSDSSTFLLSQYSYHHYHKTKTRLVFHISSIFARQKIRNACCCITFLSKTNFTSKIISLMLVLRRLHPLHGCRDLSIRRTFHLYSCNVHITRQLKCVSNYENNAKICVFNNY